MHVKTTTAVLPIVGRAIARFRHIKEIQFSITPQPASQIGMMRFGTTGAKPGTLANAGKLLHFPKLTQREVGLKARPREHLLNGWLSKSTYSTVDLFSIWVSWVSTQ